MFENERFGPTDEIGAADEYKSSDSRDFVAGVGIDDSDILTNLCAKSIVWIEKHIFRRVRGLSRSAQRPHQAAQATGVEAATDVEAATVVEDATGVEAAIIVKMIDALTCLFVPLLFTATMFALARTRRLMVRIAVVGALGFAFAVSAKLFYGRMSRGEIFAFTAAYFAVASVFVSTTDDNVSKIS